MQFAPLEFLLGATLLKLITSSASAQSITTQHFDFLDDFEDLNSGTNWIRTVFDLGQERMSSGPDGLTLRFDVDSDDGPYNYMYRSELRETNIDSFPAQGTSQVYHMRFRVNQLPDLCGPVTIFQRFNRDNDGPDLEVELTGKNQFGDAVPNTLQVVDFEDDRQRLDAFLTAYNDLKVGVYNDANGKYKVSLNGVTLAQKTGIDTLPSQNGTWSQFGLYPHGLHDDSNRADQIVSGFTQVEFVYEFYNLTTYDFEVNLNSVDTISLPTSPPPTATPSPPPTAAPRPTSAEVPSSSPSASPSPGPTPLCFSERATVQVEHKEEPVTMKDLRVGDRVLTSTGLYSPVYAFGHRQVSQLANFLQIRTNSSTTSLEISGEHMLYVHGRQGPVRSDSIDVGDVLYRLFQRGLDGQVEYAIVTGVTSVQRKGLYGPLTPDGTIVVNGILASTYVAIQSKANEYAEIQETRIPLLQASVIHILLSPLRVACLAVSSKFCEHHNDQGIHPYAALGMRLVLWGEKQFVMVQLFLLLLVLLVTSAFTAIEIIFESPCESAMLLLVAFATLAVATKRFKAESGLL